MFLDAPLAAPWLVANPMCLPFPKSLRIVIEESLSAAPATDRPRRDWVQTRRSRRVLASGFGTGSRSTGGDVRTIRRRSGCRRRDPPALVNPRETTRIAEEDPLTYDTPLTPPPAPTASATSPPYSPAFLRFPLARFNTGPTIGSYLRAASRRDDGGASRRRRARRKIIQVHLAARALRNLLAHDALDARRVLS